MVRSGQAGEFAQGRRPLGDRIDSVKDVFISLADYSREKNPGMPAIATTRGL